MQWVGVRSPEAQAFIERDSLLVQSMNQKDAYADSFCGRQRGKDRIPHQETAKAGPLRLGVNGQTAQQDGRDWVGRVAAYFAGELSSLDRNRRKRVVAKYVSRACINADIATSKVSNMIGECPGREILIK